MAMIDYGAVLFKNGTQQNHELFMDMLDAVGWVDHPRQRYPDCDFFYDYEGCSKNTSNCGECPRRTTKHMSDPKLGEWEATTGDCRGNPISIHDTIDRNYFVYVGDEHLTVVCYKNWLQVYLDREHVKSFRGAEDRDDPTTFNNWYKRWARRSSWFSVGEVMFHVRAIGKDHSRQFVVSFVYKGDYYHIVYGYGIDPDMQIWDEVKVRYVGKKQAKKIDRIYDRIRSTAKEVLP